MSRKLRVIIPIAILVLAGIGYIAHTGFGSMSAIGWSSISVLCPIGALGTMIASKTIVPRAVVSLVIAVVGIILLGRAFCAWACPVPLWKRWRTALTPKKKGSKAAKAAACRPGEEPSNSRSIVLGGALLSAAIFGFPVFCLICPVGLSFALVFILIALFGSGDVTWSVVVIPVLIVLEVVVFRKWCSHICPISALMSLVGKLNRTFRPNANPNLCVEKNGAACGHCKQVCEMGIDPRHPEKGANWSECTKCRECVISCPASAITMPFLPKKAEDAEVAASVAASAEAQASAADEAAEKDASEE